MGFNEGGTLRGKRVKHLRKLAKATGLTLKQMKKVWMSMPRKSKEMVGKLEV